jgi:hypothetical protein
LHRDKVFARQDRLDLLQLLIFQKDPSSHWIEKKNSIDPTCFVRSIGAEKPIQVSGRFMSRKTKGAPYKIRP